MAKKSQVDNLVRARKAVDDIWKEVDLRGRPWAPRGKKAKDPFCGSTIILGNGQEIVVLSLDNDGNVLIRPFYHSTIHSNLLVRIASVLMKAQIPYKVQNA